MSQVELPDQVPPSGRRRDLPWPNPNAAAAISSFVDRGPFGVAVFDTDLRFLLVSEGLAALHGQEASETVGKRIDEILGPPYGELAALPLRQALASGVPILDVETWGTFADPGARRSFTSSFYRLDGPSGVPFGVVVLITETTELRYAEAAARSVSEQLELLQQVTEALSGNDGVAEVTGVALAGAAQAVGASSALIMVVDPKGDTLVSLGTTGLVDATLTRLRETARCDGPLPHAETLQARTITLWESRAERDAEYPDLAEYSSDHQAWAFVPLLARERPIGVVVFAWRLDRQFLDSDVSLLAAVGRQCALALEQTRILDAEREARRATEFLVEVTRFVVEGLDAGVLALSNGNRILTFNHRFCELSGFPHDSITLGGDANDLLAPTMALLSDPSTIVDHLHTCRERPSETLELDLALVDGRLMVCSSSPILDRHGSVLGRVWYITDETERRAQEAEQLQALDELLVSHEYRAFLLQAAEIISQADGYVDTLDRLASVAVPVLADICLVDALAMDGRVVRMAARHSNAALQPLVDELAAKYAPDPGGTHPSIEVIHTGRARWSETMTDEFLRRTSRDDDHFALLKRLGFTSYMTLPLVADNQILGSITLVSASSGRRFGSTDLALADEFTSCVAQVVAAAHRHDSARHAAHTLQASLLPETLPEVPGLAFAVRYLPATVANDVGGDFYDVMTTAAGVTTVAIGDVAGHDMTAAAIMGKIRTAVRVLANQATGPRHFIEMLRHGWDNLELERMATLLIASVDVATGELRIASAGHPPPLLVSPSGEASFLEVKPSTPLGAPRSPVREWHGTLEARTTLLLYTDGLVEDRHRSFDAGASALVAGAAGSGGPGELCDRVLEALIPDESHHDDDIAMVALARTSIEAPPAG
jgi:serine phosphatase RsbU (regulator of sigma subunit)/PAS domain-containing protein